jgi:hypothetical protein
MLLAANAEADNGDDFIFPRPATAPASALTCFDLCKISNGDPAASVTCGPIYAPVQNSEFSTIAFVGLTVCAFDTLDVIQWHSATAPSSEHTRIIATLDDDGTVDCGLGAGVACKGARIMGPLEGWLYATSNGASIGGTGCVSWRLRVCQAPAK